MESITIRTFHNSIEAHLLKSKLESNGINCFLFNEFSSTIYPFNNNSNGGIRLQIDIADEEKALEIIKKIENAPYTNDEDKVIDCPKCKSTNIMSGINSLKGIRGILSMISLFFLGFLTVPQKTIYKCRACGEEFKT